MSNDCQGFSYDLLRGLTNKNRIENPLAYLRQAGVLVNKLELAFFFNSVMLRFYSFNFQFC